MEDDEEFDPVFVRALLVVSRFNDKFLELGGLLRQLHETAPEDFASIAKIRVLGERKARYLVQVDRAFRDLNIQPARLNKIGWSKLAVIAPVVDKDNVEWWLTQAEKYDNENLKSLVRGKPPVVGVRQILLRFSPAQFEVFVAAILAFGAKVKGTGFCFKETALIAALTKVLADLAK